MNLLRAITTVGGYTMLSRVAGLVRDVLIAAALGAGTVADCYFVALRLPNLFRRLFAEGAFSAAFVPIFSGLVETDGKAAAKKFADEAFSVLALVLLVLTLLFEAAMRGRCMPRPRLRRGARLRWSWRPSCPHQLFPILLFIRWIRCNRGVLQLAGRVAAAAPRDPCQPHADRRVLVFAGSARAAGYACRGAVGGGVHPIRLAWLPCKRAGLPDRLGAAR